MSNGRSLEEYTNEESKGQTAFTKNWKNYTFSTMAENDSTIETGLKINYLKNLGK